MSFTQGQIDAINDLINGIRNEEGELTQEGVQHKINTFVEARKCQKFSRKGAKENFISKAW